ncbi:MAG: tetratricopeptide repeat protein [Bryobacteraceae bacterium]
MRVLAPLIVSVFSLLGAPVTAATFEELKAQAEAVRQSGNLPQAIAIYQQALLLNSSWAEGWWYLGTLFYDSDQFADGEDAFAHFVKLEERAAPGWAFLGLCEFETGRYDESLRHIRHGLTLATGLQPETEDVLHFHEALLLTRLGLFDRALPLYMPFARRGTKDPALIAALGLTALRRAMLPKDVPANQQDLVMTAGKTAASWAAGDTANTEAGFRALFAGFPNAPSVHYFLGSYLLGSHPDQALAEFRRELAVNPRSADAGAMVALLIMRAGDESAALPYAQKAAEDGPSTPTARYVYGLLLTHAGDSRGIQHLEAAENLDPGNFEYHMALASAYSRFGRHDDARRERRESIALARESDPRVQK